MSWLCVLPLALSLVSGSVSADVFETPKPGPIGWEKRVAPGFDPPVEYVVVYGTNRLDSRLSASDYVAKWGPNALPVLITLYRSPEWAPWRRDIVVLVSGFRSPEALDFMIEEHNVLRGRDRMTNEERWVFSGLLYYIGQIDPKRADDLVEEGLKTPDGPHAETYVHYLAGKLGRVDRDGTGASARARLQKLLEALPPQAPLREIVDGALYGSKSVRRAKEPMDKILATEKRKAR